MKKLMILAAVTIFAAVTHAAAVGWNLAGAANYKGDAYSFFVIGQNGTDSIATITALLDAGNAIDSYAFGSGTVANNGAATIGATASGKTLDAGTYEAFFVVFDATTPTSGSTKYVVVSGASTLTKEIAATAATVTFTTGNQATFLNNADNWKSYGAVPEPTSGLLMLLGMAGLALRRKRA
ncbi:MAG: PEP-CTERM sorting domain-containing protein [Kiritimatiellae bacterium]|nr:PEP-CTERM sorting domain-containing protein [Kiritimatiellia bacterium]